MPTDDTIKRRLGRNITAQRQRKGWTQARLAETAQISHPFLLHIERGTRGASLETIEVLAHALEVDVSELFAVSADLDVSPIERSSLRKRFKKDMLSHIETAVEEIINRYSSKR